MPNSSQRYSYRKNPQISASQMAEYVSASPTRQRAIRREAKYPKTSVVAQYAPARKGLVDFLDDASRSLNHLASVINRQERRQNSSEATDWVKRDSRLSIEAIETFQRSYNRLGFAALDFQALPRRQAHLDIWPTKVSVNLDLIVRQTQRDGSTKIGGAIFLFSKGEASSKKRIEQSKNAAGLILTYCGNMLGGLGTAEPKLCFAVDVFSGIAHRPPGTFSRGARQMEICATDIAALWDTIEPPPDYDGPTPE